MLPPGAAGERHEHEDGEQEAQLRNAEPFLKDNLWVYASVQSWWSSKLTRTSSVRRFTLDKSWRCSSSRRLVCFSSSTTERWKS